MAAFFKMYYAPNNAVLAIVGDVKTDECLAKIRKYFESIPQQPPPPAVDMTEPPQTAERRQTIDDPLARLARIDIVYHIPQSMTPDADALSVLGTILSSGRSSRFYENIVRQKQLSSSVFASAGESRGPGPVPRRRDGDARQVGGGPRAGDLRRGRARQGRADRGLGDREGAQRRRAAELRRHA